MQAQRDTVIQQILNVFPPNFGTPTDPATIASLATLTKTLIDAFKQEGKLLEDPRALSHKRSVTLHTEAIHARIHHKAVLITGSAGLVGTHLLKKILPFQPSKIIAVDLAYDQDSVQLDAIEGIPLVRYGVNVWDRARLEQVFFAERPEIVFHLAAVRIPAQAEQVVRETIATNVFGTRNVLELCSRYGVENAVFASTGKCFNYVSSHVYTATKKLSEWQWMVAGRQTTTSHSMTRFTHIIDNSAVGQDIEAGIAAGVLGLHSPNRHINIQNVKQATHLLLNALAQADKRQEDLFWVASDIGWPTSILEMALYEIDQSGKEVALYFLGVPHGYDEHYFYGLYDWTGERDVHALINALEAPSSFPDSTGSMLGATVLPFDELLLQQLLEALEGCVSNTQITPDQLKVKLAGVVDKITASMFERIPAETLLRVLHTGINQQVLTTNGYTASEFENIITILVQSIYTRLDYAKVVPNRTLRRMLTELFPALAKLPALCEAMRYMQHKLDYSIAQNA